METAITNGIINAVFQLWFYYVLGLAICSVLVGVYRAYRGGAFDPVKICKRCKQPAAFAGLCTEHEKEQEQKQAQCEQKQQEEAIARIKEGEQEYRDAIQKLFHHYEPSLGGKKQWKPSN